MNLLLCVDTYKMSHMIFYPKDTTKIYSYLVARSDKKLPNVLFFGSRPYMEMLKKGVSKADVEEFLGEYRGLMGHPAPYEIIRKLHSLVDLGYIPLLIKAVPEGTILPVKNVLLTMTNTHPDFAWVVGFFESLILKIWNTCTVASYSLKLHQLIRKYSNETCDNDGHLPYQIHDFGYRGCSSEETARLSGAAHLILNRGSDTVSAVNFVRKTWGCDEQIACSVPASEHSVVSAFGREHEFEAFENMLDMCPTGIVSMVSDTYNLWNVLTDFLPRLKERILARDGRCVIRPDSGDPKKIICGDPDAEKGAHGAVPAYSGCLNLLGKEFGYTINSKGYKVLNPKVGLIYGDGFYYERFADVLETMKQQHWASSNLVVGIGGLLLQQHNRDDQAYAIKATYGEFGGVARNLLKDPITDSGKKSHTGLMRLDYGDGKWITKDKCTKAEESGGLLVTLFEDGQVCTMQKFDEIRRMAEHCMKEIL